MNFLSDMSYISEMKCGTDFSYILSDQLALSDTEYKVLQNQKDSFFIKCVRAKFNGKTQLYYSVKNYRTLDVCAPNLDAASFYKIIKNLIFNIIEIKKNGFLSCLNVLVAPQKIYIDTGTLNVFLVYLPTRTHIYEDLAEFDSDFRTKLIALILDSVSLQSPELEQLYGSLMDHSVALEDIYRQMNGFAPPAKENLYISEQPPAAAIYHMRLLSINMPVAVEIRITKPEFVLGRGHDNNVDETLDFNPSIGRMHCKIITNNNLYYIVDLESKNGTYINGRRIFPYTYEPVYNGDIIRLSNTEFRVIIE